MYDTGDDITNSGFVYSRNDTTPVAIDSDDFDDAFDALFEQMSEDGHAFTQLLLPVRTSDYKFNVDFHYAEKEKWPMGYEDNEKLKALIKPNF